ncbi:hypothetical protein EV421DRAFT_2020457 [Armillaria borealis]|uniref:Uncharacterized protein n=1 Tax=Armillaria borealis TaxID=47425 RepID=A0AA39JFF3_9AGAR|nr:hypothetical protein EV421DRAFT_2020457 [Armillaria borealis]
MIPLPRTGRGSKMGPGEVKYTDFPVGVHDQDDETGMYEESACYLPERFSHSCLGSRDIAGEINAPPPSEMMFLKKERNSIMIVRLGINGVVVTWVVAIDPPGVRFPLNAIRGIPDILLGLHL